MWMKLAAIAALPTMIALAAPAQAVPNYAVFLQSIAFDGVVMDAQQAVLEGQSVCQLLEPPNGGSLWDAAQQVQTKHPNLTMSQALAFSNRATQNICPYRGSLEEQSPESLPLEPNSG